MAGQLGPLGHAELPQSLPERAPKGAVAADEQAPGTPGVQEPAKDIGDQQRVLLRVEPPDADQPQLAVVGAAGRQLGRDHVLGIDQRHGDLEQRPGSPVAARQLGPDHDHPEPPGQQPERGLERQGRGAHQPAAGAPVANVGRQVLADAEHHAPPAQGGEQRERHGERMRAEQPDDLDLPEGAPEASQRAAGGADHRGRVGEALVVRERHELGPVPASVRGELGRGADPPDQHQVLELPCEPSGEQREGDLGAQLPVLEVVRVVAVDEQPHRLSAAGPKPRRAPRRARRSGGR